MDKNRQRPLRGQGDVRDSSDPLAEWEIELLGAQLQAGRRGGGRVRPARVRHNNQRLNRMGKKPKTAVDAEFNRQQSAAHKRGKYTSQYKPRKSRRAIKRELHGPKGKD